MMHRTSINSTVCLTAKSWLIFLSRQVDAERECMASVYASAESVDPVIADADASRCQRIIPREGLIGARVIGAPFKDQIPVAVEYFATALCISAQRGRFPGSV